MCINFVSDIFNWIGVLPTGLISFFSGLLGIITGAFLTAWLASRRDRVNRRNAFIKKQLKEFYSPMLGLRLEIRTHSELREKLQSTAGAVWQEYCRTLAPGESTQQKFEKYRELIEYDNLKLQNELIPAYNKMVALFRDNLNSYLLSLFCRVR